MPLDTITQQQFKAHAESILKAHPSTQPAIVHDLKNWREELRTSGTASTALEVCVKFLKATEELNELKIDRATIFESIRQKMDPQARFLMQMIWGFGPKVGYAPSRVLKFFESPIVSDPREYEKVVGEIGSGKMKDAYHQLCKVSGLSTSYATKVLYFESRHLSEKYALIFDDRVSEGLLRVTSPLCHRSLSVAAPRPNLGKNTGERRIKNQIDSAWRKYWAYVEGCHELAKSLGTQAENVELFLFNYPADGLAGNEDGSDLVHREVSASLPACKNPDEKASGERRDDELLAHGDWNRALMGLETLALQKALAESSPSPGTSPVKSSVQTQYCDGYCPQCLLEGEHFEMLLNTGDFWECPFCRLQAHSCITGMFALLRERGLRQLKDTRATNRIVGWVLTKVDPEDIFSAAVSGFTSKSELREFLTSEVHEPK